MTNYPRDEFDNIPETSSRQGVHRTAMETARSGLWPIVAFAVAALVVGALAFFLVPRLVGSNASEAAPAASAHASTSATSSAPSQTSAAPSSAAPTSSSAAPTSAAPTATPAPSADKSLRVGVFNASGVTGLAGRVSTQAQAAGWTVAQSGNWTGNAVQASVVYYQGADAKASAEQLAKDLGITSVVQAEQAALPLMVVLGPGAR